MSIAGSGAIGNPGFHQVAEPRLVDEDDLWALRQRRSRWPPRSPRRVSARPAPPRRRPTSSATPARASATPSVTGPTNCHLIGLVVAGLVRGVQERPQALEGGIGEIGVTGAMGRSRWRRRRGCRTGPDVMPAMPTTAWAIMPSAGIGAGSDGIAGTSYSARAKPGRLPRRAVGQRCRRRWTLPARSDCSAGTPRAERARRRHRSRLRTIGRADVDHAVQSDRSPRSERRSDRPSAVLPRTIG